MSRNIIIVVTNFRSYLHFNYYPNQFHGYTKLHENIL
jgi:hypothetical protein